MIRLRTAVLMALWVASAETLAADPPGERRLTLSRAIEEALAANPGLRSAEAHARAARWGSRRANLSFFPRVTLDHSVTRVDDRTFDTANQAKVGLERLLTSVLGETVAIEPFLFRDTYRTNFLLTQPVYLGGSLWAARGQAAAAYRGARESASAGREEVVFATRAAFLDLLRRRELLGVEQEAVGAAVRRRDATSRRLEVGSANRAELLRWEVELAAAEARRIRAENEVALAEAELNSLLGRSLTDRLQPEPVGERDFPEEALASQELQTLEKETLARNPFVAARRAAVEAARAGVSLARSEFLPSVSVGASYGWHVDDDLALDDYRTWGASLVVTMPVFDSFRRAALYAEKKAQLEAARYELEREETAALLALKEAYLAVRSARERRRVAERGEDSAAENLRVTENRYRLGAVAQVDLLDAQVAYEAARVESVSAHYDYYLALASLRLARGGIE